ncbi:MAG: hypothetical protein C0413_02430 [Clostridiales bacterium]|nr:hypothetical protein [Clostridiales bacterium]
MKRKHRLLAIGATILLLIALCVPALSGALAAGEEIPLIVPINQETAVFDADDIQIGSLTQDTVKGAVLTLSSGEAFTGVQVIFDQAAMDKAEKSEALAGKTLVLFGMANTATTSEATSVPTPETTPEVTPAVLPTQGWIDANLVVTALAAHHAADTGTIASKENDIASLQNQLSAAINSGASQTESAPEKNNGIFSPEKLSVWVPVSAIALGILGLGVLVWLAVSASNAAWESERTVRQLTKLNERFSDGLPLKTPVRIEQIAWPREGHVQLAPDVVKQLAAVADQTNAYNTRMNELVKPLEAEPEPIPEGEEPDLLQLANRLAGVASAAEWNAIVRDAGWRAVLLQANPTEKGTFIADDSGYSIVACVMRTQDADIAYVVPSYQDPNASEQRWSEFYALSENTSVRNFRVDALAVMYIERGTFFLLKTKGKLTRRPIVY